ncbi:hypothetical protein M514_03049 [Trichuris suis]|uniref:Uncharacterized protein n=1 Tax=Trichuris suis TaxID=68888 RepID=A0A085MFC9_9BILA|nr:hypothetical protein M513_03049 [Trichuris suis]KFD68316.1 hypothetical protein M514_03049 [Trichuris suis]
MDVSPPSLYPLVISLFLQGVMEGQGDDKRQGALRRVRPDDIAPRVVPLERLLPSPRPLSMVLFPAEFLPAHTAREVPDKTFRSLNIRGVQRALTKERCTMASSEFGNHKVYSNNLLSWHSRFPWPLVPPIFLWSKNCNVLFSHYKVCWPLDACLLSFAQAIARCRYRFRRPFDAACLLATPCIYLKFTGHTVLSIPA